MKRNLISLIVLLSLAACQSPPAEPPAIESPHPSPTPASAQADSPTIDESPPLPSPTPASAQTEEPTPPALDIAAQENEMPLFLEITITTVMEQSSELSPEFVVGTSAYIYNQDDQILLVAPTIELNADSQVLVGVIDVLETPSQSFEKKSILQFPGSPLAEVTVLDVDAETGVVSLQYAGETYALAPNETQSAKQPLPGDRGTQIITIIHHGQLKDMQPISEDGSWR